MSFAGSLFSSSVKHKQYKRALLTQSVKELTSLSDRSTRGAEFASTNCLLVRRLLLRTLGRFDLLGGRDGVGIGNEVHVASDVEIKVGGPDIGRRQADNGGRADGSEVPSEPGRVKSQRERRCRKIEGARTWGSPARRLSTEVRARRGQNAPGM